MSQDLQQLQWFFGLAPAFSYYDECAPDNGNAQASPQGFVLFGRYLAERLWQRSGSTLPHAAILAHEFGHILQFASGWRASGPTVRNFELEADAWAGFYGALVKGWGGESLDRYYVTLFESGDHNFNSPQHHGTPVQRLAAGGVGLLAGLISLQQGGAPTAQQLHVFFVDRIENCIVQLQDPSPCLSPTVASREGESKQAELAALIAGVDNGLIAGIARGERSLADIPAPSAELAARAKGWRLGP